MVFLGVPRSMVWNEKEAQNHHLIGDWKPIKIAIDLGGWFCQNWVLKTIIQEVQSTEGRSDSTQQAASRAQL